ncbi:Laminin G domain [Popillia japonica]|uniref:Laminin G domain n=1 Tax=Popillia japonica TaxID=7064 RepID=A0AAW1KHL0_POPJA
MHSVLLYSIFICSLIAFSRCFFLDGSTNSYSQFRKWGGGTNGSLEFEFKTDQPNGLLLYTDDGGTYDFFEIKLVEGALRLRYNLGGGAQIIIVGRELNDGHWHKVHVQRHEDRTILSVDGVSQMRTSRVDIVGFTERYFRTNTKLTLLALPSVIFEPRFIGSVRNLVYPDTEGGPPRRQETRPKDHRVSEGGPPRRQETRPKDHRSLEKQASKILKRPNTKFPVTEIDQRVMMQVPEIDLDVIVSVGKESLDKLGTKHAVYSCRPTKYLYVMHMLHKSL